MSPAAGRLVVVSGAPGTGKSTVAAAVADDLGRPLLTLDPIKEALADVLGTGDPGACAAAVRAVRVALRGHW